MYSWSLHTNHNQTVVRLLQLCAWLGCSAPGSAQADSGTPGLPPAVTGSVRSAASKAQLGQEDEVVGHGAMWRHLPASSPPVHGNARPFVHQVMPVDGRRGPFLVVWQEYKAAVRVCVTIHEGHRLAIWQESLDGACLRKRHKKKKHSVDCVQCTISFFFLPRFRDKPRRARIVYSTMVERNW